MDAASSRVPAALDDLRARCEATMSGLPDPSDDWQVVDAGVGAQDADPDVLIVGFSDFDGTAVTEDVAQTQGLGRGRYTETIDVRCILSSESGDEDVAARRDRCLEGLALVEAALTADYGPTVVDQWHMAGSRAWAQSQTPQGAACEVIFTVQCRVTR